MSRPTSQHASLPPRNSYTRTHSSTLSSASNPHRIGRRKSSTFTPAAVVTSNPAALGAAVEHAMAAGSLTINRRRTSMSRSALTGLNMPHSLPHHVSAPDQPLTSSSALVDGPSLASLHAVESARQVKARRASDGTHLTKKEKAAAGDLKCEHCGKSYKHGSCLTKHLWEHTPQWQYTSKLLISKHQQVQLLEAASVLVAMNQDGPDAAEKNDSDSSSPAASGSSDMHDEDSSSAETTPPPHTDSYRDIKRFSNTSSAYSRSYQSQSVFSESASNADHSFGHQRHWSQSSINRPATATSFSIADSYRDEDPQDLAAAVGLLSCSYGTPTMGATGVHQDIPPVPPLPAKYAFAHAPSFASYTRHQEDVVMDEGESSEDDHHHDGPRSSRIDEADDGIFGKMDA